MVVHPRHPTQGPVVLQGGPRVVVVVGLEGVTEVEGSGMFAHLGCLLQYFTLGIQKQSRHPTRRTSSYLFSLCFLWISLTG